MVSNAKVRASFSQRADAIPQLVERGLKPLLGEWELFHRLPHGAARRDVEKVVTALGRERGRLRGEGLPYHSLLDTNLRWLLALSLHRLFGGLGDYQERALESSRDWNDCGHFRPPE